MSLRDRVPVVRWKSPAARVCLLTFSADGTPEAHYEPRSDSELATPCETFALEHGMAQLRQEVVVARRAIEALKLERQAVSRAIGGREIEDTAVNEASHRAADALSTFERTYGAGRPWTENLAGVDLRVPRSPK